MLQAKVESKEHRGSVVQLVRGVHKETLVAPVLRASRVLRAIRAMLARSDLRVLAAPSVCEVALVQQDHLVNLAPREIKVVRE